MIWFKKEPLLITNKFNAGKHYQPFSCQRALQQDDLNIKYLKNQIFVFFGRFKVKPIVSAQSEQSISAGNILSQKRIEGLAVLHNFSYYYRNSLKVK
jgi:hypothetical protein